MSFQSTALMTLPSVIDTPAAMDSYIRHVESLLAAEKAEAASLRSMSSASLKSASSTSSRSSLLKKVFKKEKKIPSEAPSAKAERKALKAEATATYLAIR
ncbi:hypothetical protein W97_08475 [Coniosporium apollinis CBS 100218]|uniref:Uncharacterized protein n=1 Tax=Coniosporium apollinis (strain CBS 100218) TaxID=1168221 RepID=R7Z5M6_CONA1|nr:uncharacterized protein W97_08475 [Coniosporium apollinis CBS 100218]EON69216.1 hypothetical protein W97_08475 [Coniosporium apollinis CBS 100218]